MAGSGAAVGSCGRGGAMSRARVIKRPFVKARDFWVGEALPAMAMGTARESAFFSCFGDAPIDAPEWLPGGSVVSVGRGLVRASAAERGL